MKHIKIAAGLAHVNYGNIAGIVREISDAGVDYIHSDAADMHDLKTMDRMFIEQIDEAGADMLIGPAEHFLGAQLAYIINWCREHHLKIGLTLGCYTPLCFVEESIYDIDRLHIVTHGVDETDGKDNWGFRKSVPDLIRRARRMIDEKNPQCELALDGGLRADNMEPLIECNPDVIVLSSALFKDPEGITAACRKCRRNIDAAAEKFGLE